MLITKLGTQLVNTKYGQKEKYIVTGEQGGKVIVFDSWKGGWNANFAVGLEINPAAEQWKSREYNGKTYWTLNAPAEARSYGGGQTTAPAQPAANPQELAAIKERLDVLEVKVDSLLNQKSNEMDVEAVADMPEDTFSSEGEVRVEDVPF